MILTNDSYSMPFYFGSKENRIYNWRCVDLDSNYPYFFIEYRHKEGGSSFNLKKMVSSIDDLIQICSDIKQCINSALIQMALLSPPWISMAECWEMISLSEILSVNIEMNEPPIHVFITKDGRKLFDSLTPINLANATEVRSLLSVA